MTKFLADVLLSLSSQEHVTLGDALNALFNYTHRYQAIFDKMIKIRAQAPVQQDEPTFRRTALASDQEYQSIHDLLQKFEQYLTRFEHELPKAEQHPEVLQALCDNLMAGVDKLVKAIQHIYQGKATSFAAVLNDLLALQNLLLQKFTQSDVIATAQKQKVTDAQWQSTQAERVLKPDEKYVYVRIFHREMPSLITKKGNFMWIKPLLDSVRHAEKHGFAVYENEADVIKSLKDEQYGYVTLKINEKQDITAQRAGKTCAIVGCQLLTIKDITTANMIKLTHHQVAYDIRDGGLHRNKVE